MEAYLGHSSSSYLALHFISPNCDKMSVSTSLFEETDGTLSLVFLTKARNFRYFSMMTTLFISAESYNHDI